MAFTPFVETDLPTMANFNQKLSEINVPYGVIVMWSGQSNEIPAGWALCDGANGTPDLRGRFLVGAGGDYAVGDVGGAATETLKYIEETSGSVFGRLYGYSAGTHDNRPPYYALCFIMRV